MSPRGQHGHVLLLLSMVLLAAASAGILFATRISTRIDDRAADDARLQALWLARSALDAGARGGFSVATPAGAAQVTVSAEGARVELAGGVAVISAAPWQERYTPITPR